MIFRKEAFHEAVPSQSRFVHLGGIHDPYVGQRDQLNPGRSGGVEARQQASRQLRKRKALIAVAKVVTAGQKVTLVEVVIDLRDHAVHPVAEGCRGRQIVGGSSRRRRIAGSVQVGRRTHDIGRGPRVASQQIQDRLAQGAMIGGSSVFRRGDGSLIGNTA